MPRLTPAPSLSCGNCGRTIAKNKTHFMLEGEPSTERMVCIRCMQPAREAHIRYYPDCIVDWHDVWDHNVSFATRAAAANLLGLWPEPEYIAAREQRKQKLHTA